MTLASISLKNFTVFEDARFDLCPGINVLIGANGTGKTHAMKAAYALLRPAPVSEEPRDAYHYHTKLKLVFLPNERDARRLVRHQTAHPAIARVTATTVDGRSVEVQLSSADRTLGVHGALEIPGVLYIPSREVLSMFEGFVAAYQGREMSFDETFFDLCVAMDAKPLRGERAQVVEPLRRRLEEILGGKVVRDGSRFYVQSEGGEKIEAHLVAEGMRKIATLAHLVANGSIRPGGIVFWDEPETNLNPRLITRLADVLVELAKLGVQLVLATHDYLLSSRLSLLAEYEQVPPGTIRFFSLTRERPDGPVRVNAGDTLADLPENLMADEFARQYDFRRELFDRSHGG